ncbi:unnamed protein product [Rhizopus stolonifer]
MIFSLKNILQDPENGEIGKSSEIPSSLFLILEQLRGTLTDLQGTINNHQSNSEEAQKGEK